MNLVNQIMAATASSETIDINPDKISGFGGDGLKTLGSITISSLVSGAIALILIASALVFFFMLIVGGIKWMMAGGDKEKAGEARGQLTSALIGLMIILAAWAITALIKTLFGVDILSLTIPAFFTPQ